MWNDVVIEHPQDTGDAVHHVRWNLERDEMIEYSNAILYLLDTLVDVDVCVRAGCFVSCTMERQKTDVTFSAVTHTKMKRPTSTSAISLFRCRREAMVHDIFD